MKTKLLSLFLVCIVCVNTVSARTIESVKIGDLYYKLEINSYPKESTAQVVSSPNGYSGDINIPYSVTYSGTTCRVIGVYGWAFQNCTNLTSVTMSCPASIGYAAFYGCTNLAQIEMNGFAGSIGAQAFQNCTSLESIEVNATTIGEESFRGCSNLSSVILGDEVDYIIEKAFADCSNLRSITFGERVVNIKDSVFARCTSLDTIVWNSNRYTEYIRYSPFSEISTQVLSFTFDSDVTKIPAYLCKGMNNLNNVSLPNSLVEIGDEAFADCTGLTTITIPENVTSYLRNAFEGCSGLESVNVAVNNASYCSIDGVVFTKDTTALVFYPQAKNGNYIIPNSVTAILGGAFKDCTQLTSIEIPNSVIAIGESAFENCTGLTSVVIPNSVVTINEKAFYNCSNLTSLTISNSFIGYIINDDDIEPLVPSDIFTGCNINEIHFMGNLEDWCMWCHNLPYVPEAISSSYTLYLNETIISDLVVPDNMTSIAASTFAGCQNITSVTIPNTITSIDYHVFYGCSNLKSVTIPNSVTNVGKEAFANCTRLESVIIPESVTDCGVFSFMGGAPFKGCSNLRTVTINSNAVINRYECSSDKNMKHAFGPQVIEYRIGGNVSKIGGWAFMNCENLTSVIIGDSVTKIGWCAFWGCNLKTISIGKNVSEIEGWAFNNYSEEECLKSIVCRATTPPHMGGSTNSDGTHNNGVFDGHYPSKISLYVPKNSISAYKAADQWKDFTYIYPIVDATEIKTSDITATPNEDNSVTITWPVVENAVIYTIEIKKNGDLVCTLEFDEKGLLLSKVFAMPARNGERHNSPAATMTANGWQYVVEGLEEGTEYIYIVTAKKDDGTVILTESVAFTTLSHEVLDEVISNQEKTTKIIQDGQIFILRDDKIYSIQGQEMK